MLQRKPAENGVGAVKQPAANAQKQALRGQGQGTVEDAGHKAAAQEGQHQRGQFPLGDPVLPEKGGQDHHEGRGGVEQDRGHRQGGHLLAAEVAEGKKENADEAGAEENGQMAEANAKNTAVIDQKNQAENEAGPQIPQHDHGLRGDPQGGQMPVKQPQAPPQGAGNENTDHGKITGLGKGGSARLFRLLHRESSFLSIQNTGTCWGQAEGPGQRSARRYRVKRQQWYCMDIEKPPSGVSRSRWPPSIL